MKSNYCLLPSIVGQHLICSNRLWRLYKSTFLAGHLEREMLLFHSDEQTSVTALSIPKQQPGAQERLSAAVDRKIQVKGKH